jgi:hypothetical protein
MPRSWNRFVPAARMIAVFEHILYDSIPITYRDRLFYGHPLGWADSFRWTPALLDRALQPVELGRNRARVGDG